jgi:TPR repeat protein
LFAFAAPVWGGADYVDSLKNRAAQGEAKAQTILGLMYYEGRGVPQDYAEALKWFRLAAAQGDALAQHNLGLMYAKGYGVPQNHIEAHTWFTLAAASYTSKPNRDRAVAARDTEAARMTPAQIAEAQKLAREWKKQ